MYAVDVTPERHFVVEALVCAVLYRAKSVPSLAQPTRTSARIGVYVLAWLPRHLPALLGTAC